MMKIFKIDGFQMRIFLTGKNNDNYLKIFNKSESFNKFINV